MSNVIAFNNLDPAAINASPVKTLDNGGKMSWLNYNGPNGRQSLVMQTPFNLKLPHGLSAWEGESGIKYSLEMSLEGPEGEAFRQKLASLDERILELAMENGKTWFKKSIDRSVAEALFTSALRFPRDKETGEITDRYPPTFKASLPQRSGKFTCDAYDMCKSPLVMEDLIAANNTRGAAATAIVQCSGIWFAGGKYGMSWKVLQLLIKPNPTGIQPFAFVDAEALIETPPETPVSNALEFTPRTTDIRQDAYDEDDF